MHQRIISVEFKTSIDKVLHMLEENGQVEKGTEQSSPAAAALQQNASVPGEGPKAGEPSVETEIQIGNFSNTGPSQGPEADSQSNNIPAIAESGSEVGEPAARAGMEDREGPSTPFNN